MNFCCDGFLSFFESIPDSITSEEEFIDCISHALPALADHLQLGRLDMKLHANPTPFESDSNTHCVVLYQARHLKYSDNSCRTDPISSP